MHIDEREKIRLSDRILSALDLAIEQHDLKVAEALNRALELSMTRSTGGGEFIERRDYPPEIDRAVNKLNDLRDQNRAV